MIIPGLFKYDNAIHFISSFITTIIAYNLVVPHIDKKLKNNYWALGFILVLLASGLGSLNEIIELFGVVYLNATGVGGYINNAVDLVVNTIGSVIAYITILPHHKKNK